MPDTKKLFEPESVVELVRGWLMHAHKARDRHDLASRVYERGRYALGIPTLIVTTIVGTSVFAALSTNTSPPLWIAILSVLAAVLSALQTFLDFGTRADRHRATAVRYKAAIRALEQRRMQIAEGHIPDADALNEIRSSLDSLEEEAPVVMPRIYDSIEKRFEGVTYVQETLDLYRRS